MSDPSPVRPAVSKGIPLVLLALIALAPPATAADSDYETCRRVTVALEQVPEYMLLVCPPKG